MEEMIELEECPSCRGCGMIVHEGGWSVQVECVDCGSHTAFLEYSNETEREEAVRTAARLWNMGKVIRTNPGE